MSEQTDGDASMARVVGETWRVVRSVTMLETPVEGSSRLYWGLPWLEGGLERGKQGGGRGEVEEKREEDEEEAVRTYWRNSDLTWVAGGALRMPRPRRAGEAGNKVICLCFFSS